MAVGREAEELVGVTSHDDRSVRRDGSRTGARLCLDRRPPNHGARTLIQRVEESAITCEVGAAIAEGEGRRNIFPRLGGTEYPAQLPRGGDGKSGAGERAGVDVAVLIDGRRGVDTADIIRG